ncbi:EAL domain-containing protein [Sporosarcina sp. 179-K 3D1 HS]|uniref:sensor domain-containing phosphodiesterase n=1 Tax=Sporosarcina sp. 179-K 3D1 HS TaxID=3232169 RepID=UPI0039A2C69C
MGNNEQVRVWRDQSKIIHHISSGMPLHETLDVVMTSLERSCEPQEMSGSILLYNSEQKLLNRMIASSLPKHYTESIPEIKVESGSPFVKPTFIGLPKSGETESMDTPWNVLHQEACKLGFRSSWVLPITSANRRLLGVFLLHFRDTVGPDEDLLCLINVYKDLACIAIGNAQCCQNWRFEQRMPNTERSADAIEYQSDLEILSQLHEALEKEQFEVYYQPYFGLGNGGLGMEALIRWNHPEEGILPPAAFLAVAEESGLILDMETWVLRKALHDAVRLQRKGLCDLLLSVNISAQQLDNPDFPGLLADLLQEVSFQPEQLTLEVTERFLIKRSTIQAIERIKQLGVRISIDDFGTAYSSLQYLKDLPVNELKIDRGFISNMETSKTNQKIVEMIIMLGHQLDLTVVAEGVETEKQLQLLSDLKCDRVQGFYYSKPIPLAAFEELYVPVRRVAQGI